MPLVAIFEHLLLPDAGTLKEKNENSTEAFQWTEAKGHQGEREKTGWLEARCTDLTPNSEVGPAWTLMGCSVSFDILAHSTRPSLRPKEQDREM